MSEEQKSFPVKYMPVLVTPYSSDFYNIKDTSIEGCGKIICTAYSQEVAYKITKFLNESEGYVYRP
jgi:hypothetical protein